MKNVSYEVVLFRTKNDVSHEEALKKLNSLTQILQSFSGFLERKLSVSDDGLWMDYVTWRSKEEALATAKEVMQNPNAVEVFAIIEESSLQMYHFKVAH